MVVTGCAGLAGRCTARCPQMLLLTVVAWAIGWSDCQHPKRSIGVAVCRESWLTSMRGASFAVYGMISLRRVIIHLRIKGCLVRWWFEIYWKYKVWMIDWIVKSSLVMTEVCQCDWSETYDYWINSASWRLSCLLKVHLPCCGVLSDWLLADRTARSMIRHLTTLGREGRKIAGHPRRQ